MISEFPPFLILVVAQFAVVLSERPPPATGLRSWHGVVGSALALPPTGPVLVWSMRQAPVCRPVNRERPPVGDYSSKGFRDVRT